MQFLGQMVTIAMVRVNRGAPGFVLESLREANSCFEKLALLYPNDPDWTIGAALMLAWEATFLLQKGGSKRPGLDSPGPRSSWSRLLAQVLDPDEPAQAKRRQEVIARAAEILDDPGSQPRLLPAELELRAEIEAARAQGAAELRSEVDAAS